MSYLLPIAASVLPFFCWILERFLPYPYLVEELAKALLVYFLIKKDRHSWYQAIIAGVFFALTETVFYTFNLYASGNTSFMAVRLLTTSLLHSLTYLTITFFYVKGNRYFVIGIILAILIHIYYNQYLAVLLLSYFN
jgi:RsiW-degrading membrane proteinase PrsW (M82 family)